MISWPSVVSACRICLRCSGPDISSAYSTAPVSIARKPRLCRATATGPCWFLRRALHHICKWTLPARGSGSSGASRLASCSIVSAGRLAGRLFRSTRHDDGMTMSGVQNARDGDELVSSADGVQHVPKGWRVVSVAGFALNGGLRDGLHRAGMQHRMLVRHDAGGRPPYPNELLR